MKLLLLLLSVVLLCAVCCIDITIIYYYMISMSCLVNTVNNINVLDLRLLIISSYYCTTLCVDAGQESVHVDRRPADRTL